MPCLNEAETLERCIVKAMRAIKEAGYAGERVVLMHPTDQVYYDAMSHVVAAALRALWRLPEAKR